MMKLARCTHTPVKWPHEDLACITHDGHLLPAPRLVSALDQDRRDRGRDPRGGPRTDRLRDGSFPRWG